MDILSELQPIFRDIFDDPSLVVTVGTNADMIEDWDSIAHVRLIMAIEKHFGIRFSFDELQGLKNAGEMVSLIEKKLGKD